MTDETEEKRGEQVHENELPPEGVPSNAVYARVGDTIKSAAHECVQRGMNSHDIIRELAREHDVHFNVGELRLLLAARRVPEDFEK